MAPQLGPKNIAQKVIVTLIENGPMTSRDLADTLKRQQLSVYRALLRLKKDGIVTSYPKPSARSRHLWRIE